MVEVHSRAAEDLDDKAFIKRAQVANLELLVPARSESANLGNFCPVDLVITCELNVWVQPVESCPIFGVNFDVCLADLDLEDETVLQLRL